MTAYQQATPARARHRAITELIERHRSEYDKLHDEARTHLGLAPMDERVHKVRQRPQRRGAR